MRVSTIWKGDLIMGLIGYVVGYRWKVYYDSSLLHEDDEVFEEEDDAYEEARSYIESKIKDYEVDGSEYDEDSFCIVIIDEYENEIVY